MGLVWPGATRGVDLNGAVIKSYRNEIVESVVSVVIGNTGAPRTGLEREKGGKGSGRR
jgi:hypothetical protein